MKAPRADLVIYNANIYTLDPRRPRATSLAVCGERIIAVGDNRDMLALAGPRARVIDCRGLTVIPGFNDNHVHLLGMGFFFQFPNLFGLDARQIVAALKKHYRNLKPGKVVTGFAWDYPFCPDPSKDILDAAFPRNPVILRQYSGHAQWMNSRALDGMLRRKRRGAGGEIVRSPDGRPTGIVRGTVVHPRHRRELVRRALDPGLHRRLVRSAFARFARAGITSAQDNTWQPFTVWHLASLRRRGRLSCRVSAWAFGQYPLLARSMDFCPYDPLWMRRGPEKYIVDGAFSPHTARMLEPFEGEPENRGRLLLDAAALSRIVARGAVRRRQLAFHAIGDAAVRAVIDAVEEQARRRPVVKNLRIRIEHAQLIDQADMKRIRELVMAIAAQPTALAQPERDRRLVGDRRFHRLYPYRSLLDAGVRLSFGSDIPGEIEYNPFQVIYRAASRRGGPESEGSYGPAEAVTVEEALFALTRGSAYAEFMENQKGMLAPGMLADFIVLSDDLLRTAVEEIPRLRVLLTVVGGRAVFSEM